MRLLKHDAPPSLVSLIWSVAGILGLFFAIIISSFFVLKKYYPVDADSAAALPVQGNCSQDKSKVAIHNYPGIPAVNEAFPNDAYKHKTVIEALGGAYQCSNICVKGIDRTKSFDSEVNQSAIKAALDGATVDGKPMTFVPSGREFVNLVKEAGTSSEKREALKRVAIIPFSKSVCVGYTQTVGGSVAYKDLKYKDGEAVEIESPNNTREETKKRLEAEKKAREEAQKAAADQPAPEPILKDTGEGPLAPVTTFKEERKPQVTWKCIKYGTEGFVWFYKAKLGDQIGWQHFLDGSMSGKGNWFANDGLVQLEKEGNISKNPTKDCDPVPTKIPDNAVLETTTSDYKSAINSCRDELNQIVKKHSSRKDKSLQNFLTDLKGALKYLPKDTTKSTYDKCMKWLAQAHGALDTAWTDEQIEKYAAEMTKNRQRITFKDGSSMQRFIGQKDYAQWEGPKLRPTGGGLFWSSPLAWKVYEPTKQIYATWVFYLKRDPVNSKNDKRSYFWSIQYNGKYYSYDPATKTWNYYSRQQYYIAADTGRPNYIPAPWPDTKIVN